MKNPFLSNDNIFEKLNRREPVRRDKTPEARNTSKDRMLGDRVSFGRQQNCPKQIKKQCKVESGYDKGGTTLSDNYLHLEEYHKADTLDQINRGRLSPKAYERPSIQTSQQYQITTQEPQPDSYKPAVQKPNPFQNSISTFDRGRLPRKSQQLSQLTLKEDTAHPRQKSVTGQRRTTIESFKAEYEPGPYVPTPQNTLPSLNLQTIQNKTQPSASGYDTLQKLNEIFGTNPMMSPKSQDLAFSQGHYEPSVPFSPLSTGRPDDIDPNLFQQYVQRCLMDSKGRQELEKLVGMEIPQVSSPKSNNIKIEDRYNFAPTIRSPPRNNESSTRIPTFSRLAQNTKPTINLPPPYSPAIAPAVAVQKQPFSSELKIREPSDFIGDLQSMRSDEEIVKFEESMTKMKPYVSPILTEKSNLKQPAQQTKMIGSPREGGMLLSTKCNLSQRINDKVRHMYQRNDTRVFLTITQKLTMRRCPLSE